jgi:hypothetical protein
MRNLIWLLVSGISVGWLVGLSVSPVLGNVLTPIVAIVVTVVAALSGIRGPKRDISFVSDTRPLGAFLLALAVSSTAGMFFRFLASSPTLLDQANVSSEVPLGLFSSFGGEEGFCNILLTNDFSAALSQIRNQRLADEPIIELLTILDNSTVDHDELVRLICSE